MIVFFSLLPTTLARLCQISATVMMAVPMLEFLSGKKALSWFIANRPFLLHVSHDDISSFPSLALRPGQIKFLAPGSHLGSFCGGVWTWGPYVCVGGSGHGALMWGIWTWGRYVQGSRHGVLMWGVWTWGPFVRGSGHDNIGWKNVMLNVLRAVSLAIQGTYSNTTCCSHATSASSSRPSETVIYIKVMQFVSYVLGNLNTLHEQFDK